MDTFYLSHTVLGIRNSRKTKIRSLESAGHIKSYMNEWVQDEVSWSLQEVKVCRECYGNVSERVLGDKEDTLSSGVQVDFEWCVMAHQTEKGSVHGLGFEQEEKAWTNCRCMGFVCILNFGLRSTVLNPTVIFPDQVTEPRGTGSSQKSVWSDSMVGKSTGPRN